MIDHTKTTYQLYWDNGRQSKCHQHKLFALIHVFILMWRGFKVEYLECEPC